MRPTKQEHTPETGKLAVAGVFHLLFSLLLVPLPQPALPRSDFTCKSRQTGSHVLSALPELGDQ